MLPLYLKEYRERLKESKEPLISLLSIEEENGMTRIDLMCKVTTHSKWFYIKNNNIYDCNMIPFYENKLETFEDLRYWEALQYLI